MKLSASQSVANERHLGGWFNEKNFRAHALRFSHRRRRISGFRAKRQLNERGEAGTYRPVDRMLERS